MEPHLAYVLIKLFLVGLGWVHSAGEEGTKIVLWISGGGGSGEPFET